MIPGSINPLLLASAAAGAAANYEIERSLRFNSADSAYLNRTPASAGNRQTWTWSGWIKRSALSSNMALFSAESGSSYTIIGFRTGNIIDIELFDGVTETSSQSTSVFRDISAWYHLVVVLNTTAATASNRVIVYVNNVSQSLSTFPAQNTTALINAGVSHNIGRYSGARYFSGYLADIHFIDGQALTPSSFGQADANGVWQPKAYTGTYGTNGFKLNFADNSNTTAATLGKDLSGSANNWTPNNLSVYSGNVATGSIGGSYSAEVGSLANVLDQSTNTGWGATVGSNGATVNVTLNFTGVSGISSLRVYAYFRSGQSGQVSVNGGAYTGYTLAEQVGWVNVTSQLSGSPTLTSLTWRMTHAIGGSETALLYAVEVNGSIIGSLYSNSDSLVDVPTAFGTDAGAGGQVRGNYCTLNPLVGGANSGQITFANGNLDATWSTTDNYAVALGSIGVNSGKWYWETLITGNSGFWLPGIALANVSLTNYIGGDALGYGYYSVDGRIYNNSVASSYGSSYTTNDIIGIAFDADNGKVFFAKNGVWQASGNPVAGTNAAYTGLTGRFFPAYAEGTASAATAYSCNFGQRPFAYTAPSGFKALCTQNLPEGTITTSGTFTGNANANGPLVYLNGVPTTMTINGNAVTFATHADKLANGFKLRTNSVSYNQSGSNTYSVSATGDKFKNARAQINP